MKGAFCAGQCPPGGSDDALSRLFAHSPGGIPPAQLEALARRLLDRRSDEAGAACRSGLSHDATPLQLCISAAPAGNRTRLIADPAATCPDPAERYARARETATALLDGHPRAAHAFERLLALAAPAAPAGYGAGVLWLAAGVEDGSAAIYLDMGPPGSSAAWEMAGAWLSEILPDAGAALALLATLRTGYRLASLGLEGGRGPWRAKLYWRLERAAPPDGWGSPLFALPAFGHFLSACLDGGQSLRTEGLTLGAGFGLDDGRLRDVKADLCCCPACLRRGNGLWQRLLATLATPLGIDTEPLRQVLANPAAAPALIGLGVEAERQTPRLNLYIKPVTAGIDDEPRRMLEAAVAGLAAVQGADGRWLDYHELPVGASDQWITAYVGLALAEAADAGVERAHEPARQVADWLAGPGRTYAEGWGYNGGTGADADSTACAVLLLQRLGLAVPASVLDWLESLWRPAGGFATYPRGDGWGDGHACVTGAVGLALLRAGRRALEQPMVDYLRRNRDDDGLWPAYWWRGPYYGSYVNLRLAAALGADELLRAPAGGHTYDLRSLLEIAAMLGCELLRGRAAPLLWQELSRHQRADGLWPGGNDLRVTDPGCRHAETSAAGDCYRDDKGLFTSATAVRVLAQAATAGAFR